MVRTLVLHCDVTFQNSACATSVVTMITFKWYTLRFHMSVPFEGVNFLCQIINLFFHNFNGSFKEHNFVNNFKSVIVVTSYVMSVWELVTKFTAMLHQEELACFGVSFCAWFVHAAQNWANYFTWCFLHLSPNLHKPHWKYLQTCSIFSFFFFLLKYEFIVWCILRWCYLNVYGANRTSSAF